MANRVLIVDDDPDIRSMVSEALVFEGYEVEAASNGAEALRAIKRQQPSTMLLDMRMPILDGWGVAGALRDLGLSVRTVVMTVTDDACRWAEEIAAEGYLAKPFNLDELFAAVEPAFPA
jgi:two-component system chemotaxis response regulator CheY